jgi:hypothetical protein
MRVAADRLLLVAAVTAVAAPVYFSQGHAHGAAELTGVFDTFERLNADGQACR